MKREYDTLLETICDRELLLKTQKYCSEYWLNSHEFSKKWQPIKDVIFRKEAKCFPEIMFNPDYELILVRGGMIFTQEDYEKLQLCMRRAGDQYWVVFSNSSNVYVEADKCDSDNSDPFLIGPQIEYPVMLKFPSCLSWQGLLSGGLFSEEIFQMGIRDYFVYGDSGMWGKYVANDYVHPLDVIGYRRDVATTFRELFSISKREKAELEKKWIPKEYISLCRKKQDTY